MQTREIPRNEWSSFFHAFNSSHHGWVVRMEIFSPEIGAQVEARRLPLEGISVDEKENGGTKILITIGSTPGNHITHAISGPTRVQLETADSGIDESLQFSTGDGTTTLIRFARD